MHQSKSYWPQVPPDCNLNVSDSTIAALCEIKTEFKSEKIKLFAPLISDYLDYIKRIRATCYILRVFRVIAARIKINDERKSFLSLHISPLTVVEREDARTYLIRCVQKECFGDLYDHIKSLKEKICDRVPKNLKISFP